MTRKGSKYRRAENKKSLSVSLRKNSYLQLTTKTQSYVQTHILFKSLTFLGIAKLFLFNHPDQFVDEQLRFLKSQCSRSNTFTTTAANTYTKPPTINNERYSAWSSDRKAHKLMGACSSRRVSYRNLTHSHQILYLTWI